MIARLIPIVLILSAGFLWKYEKQIRHQTEKRLKTVSEQYAQSQIDLVSARRTAETATEEKRFLIQQLGERDEHIRRLLAEMIRLLSGSASVDLGEVLVRTKAPGAWDGVNGELRNIVAQNPLGGAANAAPIAPVAAGGLRQIQVESQPMPAAIQGAVVGNGPTPAATIFTSLANRDGQILTVNGEHRFVVISQGSQNGLKKNAIFDAYSDGKKIGRIQVGTVYDRISTASIIDGDFKLFREGSAVRLEPIAA